MKRARAYSFTSRSGKRRALTMPSMTINYDISQDLVYHAYELFRKYESGGITADIEEAVRIHRDVLDQRKEGHPRRDESLSYLAECLRARFQTQGVPADLYEAISLFHATLQLRPLGHPRQLWTLGDLASCLALKFRSSEGKMIDLSHAISILQDVLGFRPAGDPNRSWTLYNLATCFQLRFGSQRTAEDLQKAISLYREALELRPVGHPHRASTLSELASCLNLKFRLLGMNADLDEAILHHNAALELRPEGHPDRHASLNNLAIALEGKFVSQDSVTYLDQAISLHQAALELRAVGSPYRPSSLGNLAICFKRRFDSQGAVVDLNNAVDILRTLGGSHTFGSSNNSRYLSSLASCLEARYHRLHQFSDLEEAMKIRQELRVLPLSCHLHQDAGNHSCTQQVTIGVVQAIQESLPPRLLDTQSGVICDRAMQISKFTSSSQYQELLSLAQNHKTMQQGDIEHIRMVVAKYFRYATLSHRWGEAEPLLEHVAGHSIYSILTEESYEIPIIDTLPKVEGIMKLQNFCRIAKEHGFSWAWSDTCCINKNNSIIEVQEAIGSMFSWYRQSALTIVYLADVYPNATAGELSGSEWFRRGWTLQELLAPQTILFYSQDWSLFMAHESSNHKRDSSILTELERATGIPLRYLTSFCPDMNDARLRLQWAASRRTTRSEDIAYSLFGIFDLHLPVLYGEAKEKALGRLLQEIIAQSGDTSVLDWSGRPSSYHSCFPASIESYCSPPSVLPELGDVAFDRSLSRLRNLVDPRDARRFYSALISLPLPHFANRRLQLPCIVHHVQSIQFKKIDINDYSYEIQASDLRPLMFASLDRLKPCSKENRTHYVLVRVLDQKLLESWEEHDSKNVRDEDGLGAAYRVMVELDRPFSALLLEQVSRRVYRRVASSHVITARIVDSKSVATSEPGTLIIV